MVQSLEPISLKSALARWVKSELWSYVKVEVAVMNSPVPNSPYGLCGRKATLNSNTDKTRAQELFESGGGRHELPGP